MIPALKTLKSELQNAFLERTDEIQILLTALVCQEPVLLVGDPGTAKSKLANAFAKALSGSYFPYLITRYTTPDEIIGHYSLKQLKDNDIQQRKIANKLADCKVGFLDEVIKGNSALQNALLTIMEERMVDIGEGKRIPIPLQLLVGASNEYPVDGNLEAFWDRWTFRRHVNSCEEEDSFIRLMLHIDTIGKVNARLDLSILDQLRDDLKDVDLSDCVDILLSLKSFLKDKKIKVSDRRWVKAFKAVKAQAVMNGRLVAQPKDVRILTEMLWDKPHQRASLVGYIAEQIAGDELQAIKLRDCAKEIFDKAMTPKRNGGLNLDLAIDCASELKKQIKEFEKLEQDNEDILKYYNQVKSWRDELSRKVKRIANGT